MVGIRQDLVFQEVELAKVHGFHTAAVYLACF